MNYFCFLSAQFFSHFKRDSYALGNGIYIYSFVFRCSLSSPCAAFSCVIFVFVGFFFFLLCPIYFELIHHQILKLTICGRLCFELRSDCAICFSFVWFFRSVLVWNQCVRRAIEAILLIVGAVFFLGSRYNLIFERNTPSWQTKHRAANFCVISIWRLFLERLHLAKGISQYHRLKWFSLKIRLMWSKARPKQNNKHHRQLGITFTQLLPHTSRFWNIFLATVWGNPQHKNYNIQFHSAFVKLFFGTIENV